MWVMIKERKIVLTLPSEWGGWFSLHLVDHQGTMWKKQTIDFPKVNNELGKVTKFESSSPIFCGEIDV